MLPTILAHYDLPTPTQTLCLDNAGGFSGSIIWKIETGNGSYCLRCWPEQTDRKKLQWIHHVLQFVRAHGCPEVVAPIITKSGATIVHREGYCWELCDWVPGFASYDRDPNPQRLHSAIETLTRFHRASAQFHLDFAHSSNLGKTIGRLNSFDKSVAAIDKHGNLRATVLSGDDWHFFKTSGRKLAAETLQQLQPAGEAIFPVQPVIRDIRDEHLFFAGDEVCGIIDFGAMQIDTVTCDLSRMLGSMIGSDRVQLQQAVEQYCQFRCLSDQEIKPIQPLIVAGSLIGVLNWLHWLVIENRKFDSIETVRARVGQLVKVLRRW